MHSQEMIRMRQIQATKTTTMTNMAEGSHRKFQWRFGQEIAI